MTAEEYRQKMIQAFHNADCDGLIAVVCLPTEKEFKHLEWLLKTHYKKEHCEDAISRRLAIVTAEQGQVQGYEWLFKQLCTMPSVIPVPKFGQWIPVGERLPEENETVIASTEYGVYPEAKYTKRYGWEWAYEAGCDYWEGIKEIVTAWMPLPEKYEPESEDKE